MSNRNYFIMCDFAINLLSEIQSFFLASKHAMKGISRRVKVALIKIIVVAYFSLTKWLRSLRVVNYGYKLHDVAPTLILPPRTVIRCVSATSEACFVNSFSIISFTFQQRAVVLHKVFMPRTFPDRLCWLWHFLFTFVAPVTKIFSLTFLRFVFKVF